MKRGPTFIESDIRACPFCHQVFDPMGAREATPPWQPCGVELGHCPLSQVLSQTSRGSLIGAACWPSAPLTSGLEDSLLGTGGPSYAS